MKQELLRLENITLTENGQTILNSVSLNIFRGSRLCMCGMQECGSSSAARILAGLLPISSGRIVYKGKCYGPADYTQFSKKCLLRVQYLSEQTALVPSMSIAENLFALRIHSLASVYSRHDAIVRTRQLLEEYGLSLNPELPVSGLVNSLQHLLQIIKAVNTGAELIILDDIARNYTPREKKRLFECLEQLGKCAVLYVSTSLDPCFSKMDQIIVMKKGRIAGHRFSSGYSASDLYTLITGKPETGSGMSHEISRPRSSLVLLELFHTGAKKPLAVLHEGEFLEITDFGGALYHTLNHLEENRNSFTLQLKGMPIDTYAKAAGSSCYFVTESHIRAGLFPSLSFQENIAISGYPKISRAGVISGSLESFMYRSCENYFTSAPASRTKWDTVKALLFRCLAVRPSVLILGMNLADITPAGREELETILGQFLKAKTSVLLVSVGYNELAFMCDRRLILEHDGAIEEEEFVRTDSPSEKISE